MAAETEFTDPPRGHIAILLYNPTDGTWQALQGDDVDTAIPAAGNALLASALLHGYDGTTWRKQPLIWGHTDRWVEQKSNTSAAAGTNVLTFGPVPSGYVYTLDALGAVDVNNACSIELDVTGDSIGCAFVPSTARAAGQWLWKFPIGLRLVEGDTVHATLYGCTLNDDLYARVWGSIMAIDQ